MSNDKQRVRKTIYLDSDVADRLQELADKNRRSFAGQAEFIINNEIERDDARVPLVKINDPKK
jgi:predicted transcriptional regulator